MTDGPIVQTRQGAARGATASGVHVFKGMRYGASTEGANRFRAPQPPPRWDGVQDALAYGPSCAQPGPARKPEARQAWFEWAAEFGMEDEAQFGLSEDCLRLNVWTRGLGDGVKRPVMVRIHGGGFAMGSGSWGWHDGAALAKRGDVVVVTVNHRLGILGYLQLGEAWGADFAASGNAGMLDLVAALEWVRDNIEAFGGDPGNVTIFGESGGGAKTGLLTVMPAARGLFHRAIIQSAPVASVQTTKAAGAVTEGVLGVVGVKAGDIAAMQTLPVEQLLRAQAKATGPLSPFEDGKVIPGQPGALTAAGRCAPTPLMIGTNRHEVTLFLSRERDKLIDMDEARLIKRVTTLVGGDEARANALIAHYRKLWPQAQRPIDVLVLIQSDQSMRIPSIRFAERKIEGRTGPVYMYLMAWETSAQDGFIKAAHGMEVPLTMDNVDSTPAVANTPGARELAAQMSAAWIAFARTGDPNHPGMPAWPAYDLQRRSTMVFDVSSAIAEDPQGERAIWAEMA